MLLMLLYVLPSCTGSRQKDESIASPVVLSHAGGKASCVFMTTDEKDIPVVSWVEADSMDHKRFYFAYWDAGSRKFAAPHRIPIADNASIHEEGMPKIAIRGDGSIIAIYETSIPSSKSKWGISDVCYIQSFDKGKSWTGAQSISKDKTTEASCSFAGLCRLGDGEIGACWLDTDPDPQEKGRPVMFAKTAGRGGFEKPVLIEPRACQCCRTAIAGDKSGHISIAYRDLLPGSVRDISVSLSSNDGKTFQRPAPFSNDHWVIDGCPHNGPSIATRNNKTYVAWFSGGMKSGVHYAELDNSGKMLVKKDISANGRFIQLCLLPNGTRITAYNKNYKDRDSIFSKIVLNKIDGNTILEKEITPPHVFATYPVVQPANDNNVIVAWSDRGRIYYQELNTDTILDNANESAVQAISPEKIPPSVFAALSSKTDPVCGMPLTNRTISDTTLFRGKTAGFCSKHCKEQFLKEPDNYSMN